jgi:hypothetical protein
MEDEDLTIVIIIVGSLVGVLLVSASTFYCIVRARHQRLASTLQGLRALQPQSPKPLTAANPGKEKIMTKRQLSIVYYLSQSYFH